MGEEGGRRGRERRRREKERNAEWRQNRRKEMRIEEIGKWKYIMQLGEVS